MTASDESWWQESWSKWQPRILLHGIRLTDEGDPIIRNLAGLAALSEANKDVWEFQFDNGEWLCVRLREKPKTGRRGARK